MRKRYTAAFKEKQKWYWRLSKTNKNHLRIVSIWKENPAISSGEVSERSMRKRKEASSFLLP